jgi:predicted nucleic acid-binding protein
MRFLLDSNIVSELLREPLVTRNVTDFGLFADLQVINWFEKRKKSGPR